MGPSGIIIRNMTTAMGSLGLPHAHLVLDEALAGREGKRRKKEEETNEEQSGE